MSGPSPSRGAPRLDGPSPGWAPPRLRLALAAAALAAPLLPSLYRAAARRDGAASSGAAACALAPGQRAAYDLRLSARTRLQLPAGLDRGGGDGELRLQAVLEQQVLRGLPEGRWLVAARLRDVTLGGERAPAEAGAGGTGAAPAELTLPVLLRVDCRLRVEAVAHQAAAPAAVRDEWQILLKMAEVLRPAGEMAGPKASALWREEQEDTLGRYLAAYERRGPARGGPLRVTRRRLAYLRLHRGPAAGAGPAGALVTEAEVAQAQASAEWSGASGLPRAVEASEEIVLRARGEVLARTSGALSLRPREAAGLDLSELGRDEGRFTFAPATQLSAPPDPLQAAAGAPRPLDEVLGELARLLLGERPHFEQAVSLLVAQLRGRPEAAAELLARLRAGALPEGLRPTLFLALQLTGARELLRSAAGETALPLPDRLRAVAALRDVPGADRGLVDALRELGRGGDDEQVRAAARLGLAAQLRRPELPAEERARVLDDLRGQLAGASGAAAADPASLAMALDTVAEAGEPGAALAAEVAPLCHGDSGRVRAAAYRALTAAAALPPPPDLLTALLAETDGAARAAIAAALLSQVAAAPPDEALLARAAAALLGAPGTAEGASSGGAPLDEGTREVLLRVLCAAPRSAAARDALRRQLPRETAPRLLSLIGQCVPIAELR